MDTARIAEAEPAFGSVIELHDCCYGKSGVRLIKVERQAGGDHFKDLSIDIQMFGNLRSAYCWGDNSLVLPTDTMKNTIYVLASQGPIGEIEDFARRLAGHFLSRNLQAESVRISVLEFLWEPVRHSGRVHPHAFQLIGPERRGALVDHNRECTLIESSIRDFALIKTAQSAFENFLRDEFTTLRDTKDRLLSTSVTAEWRYVHPPQNFGELWKSVRDVLMETFAVHESRSLQHTLAAMGSAVLQHIGCVDEVRLTMPNRHCSLVDLSPFHISNPNEVFIPTDEPRGVITAVLKRSERESGINPTRG